MLRIGLVLVAIGVALFAGYISSVMPNAAKVGLAYTGAIAMFVAGKVFERTLQNFSRPVMAAALAIGFFVSFASYYVPAMRCLPPLAALAWMLGGITAILLFAERWRSQSIAGLAIFLGHVSAFVAADEADAFCLVLIAFLSMAAAFMALRHRWRALSLFAVGAAYVSHFAWTLVSGSLAGPEAALITNLGFLTSYYLIFLATDLIGRRRDLLDGLIDDRDASAVPSLAFGPANLIAYASLVSYYYVRTDVFMDQIHYFFFTLAAVQFAVGLARARLKDPDAVLYPALGTVFLTLGFVSAYEALTLNLVLAAEAIVLLLAAHRTKLWIFHGLAQAAMGLNFIHYWVISPPAEWTTAYFMGGVITAGAYLLKSSLEERWYGKDGRIEWRGDRTPGPIMKPFADAFDEFFSHVSPALPHFHAVAGMLIFIHQCVHYYTALDAPFALAIFAVGLAVLGLARRSVPMLMAFVTLQAGVLYASLALSYPPSIDSLRYPDWLLWWLVVLGTGASLAVSALAARRFSSRGRCSQAVMLSQVSGWCVLLAAFVGFLEGDFFGPPYLLWIAALGLAFVAQGITARHWEKAKTDMGSAAQLFRGACGLTCVAVASLVLVLTHEQLNPTAAVPSWLVLWSLVLIAVSAFRKSPGFYLGGMLILVGAYVSLLPPQALLDEVTASLPATVWMVGATLALALAKDFAVRGLGDRLADGARVGAEVAVYLPYALATLLAAQAMDHRFDFPEPIIALALLAFALFFVSSLFRLRRGVISSFLVMMLAHGVGLRRYALGVDIDAYMLGCAILFALQAVGYERLLRKTRWSDLSDRGGGIVRFGRGVLIVSATALMMLVIDRSQLLGDDWTTAVWSGVGAILMALGFLWDSALYRRAAMGLFSICLCRVFLLDLQNLDALYRFLAFILLGLSFITVSWLYARNASAIRKWL